MDRDPGDFEDVEGFNTSQEASVPSAVSGRTAQPEPLGPSATGQLNNVKKQKKRKTLAQKLAPKRVLRQTLGGVKGAADKVESLVRGDSWTRKHRSRRSSVDPVTMAADTAYRRRTKELETVVCTLGDKYISLTNKKPHMLRFLAGWHCDLPICSIVPNIFPPVHCKAVSFYCLPAWFEVSAIVCGFIV